MLCSLINTHPRPVGNACRNNPIQLLIPCHRVIGKNNIGGFSGGDIKNNGNMIVVKKNLLALEKESLLTKWNEKDSVTLWKIHLNPISDI